MRKDDVEACGDPAGGRDRAFPGMLAAVPQERGCHPVSTAVTIRIHRYKKDNVQDSQKEFVNWGRGQNPS